MPQYIQFYTRQPAMKADEASSAETEPSIMVEVDEGEALEGISKAGLRDVAEKTVAKAVTLLDDAVRAAITTTATAFYHAIQELKTPPKESEISFGLKVNGEVGNVAISKAGAESNFSVKLTWKN